MVGWHHRLDGHEFEQVLGDGEGQAEHSQQREKFFGTMFLQFIGQQVWGLLLSRLCPSSSITAASSSSLEMEYLFSLGSCVLLSMIVQQLVEILRLSQEEMGTCPFSPPC